MRCSLTREISDLLLIHLSWPVMTRGAGGIITPHNSSSYLGWVTRPALIAQVSLQVSGVSNTDILP